METNYPYKKRIAEEKLLNLFSQFPAVVVTGARQVGKSTLLEKLFPDFQKVIFDPDIDIENANQDPDLFLNNRRTPLILDEIQYAPALIPAIKRRLDKNKKPGQYLMTGSQQWNTMKNLAESLAGRVVFLDLDSFGLVEIYETDLRQPSGWLSDWLFHQEDFLNKNWQRYTSDRTLFEQLWRGFLPETQFLRKDVLADFFIAYERTYLQRDVRSMGGIADVQLFDRFYRLCSAFTGTEINYNHIGRELNLTPQTASRWLELLKASFQWFELKPWHGNTIKKISRKPKGFFNDTGLACHALAISTPEAISTNPHLGKLFETAVISEIRKQSNALPLKPEMYHWRSHSGSELDLLLEINGSFYPIEIKLKSHPQKKDFSGITAFRKNYPKLNTKKGAVISTNEGLYPVSDQDIVIPWDLKMYKNY